MVGGEVRVIGAGDGVEEPRGSGTGRTGRWCGDLGQVDTQVLCNHVDGGQ